MRATVDADYIRSKDALEENSSASIRYSQNRLPLQEVDDNQRSRTKEVSFSSKLNPYTVNGNRNRSARYGNIDQGDNLGLGNQARDDYENSNRRVIRPDFISRQGCQDARTIGVDLNSESEPRSNNREPYQSLGRWKMDENKASCYPR